MDQQQLRKLEALCIQDEPPACQAGCPLNVDSRAFVGAMAEKDFRKARTFLDKSMGLTNIIAHLCEAPCERYCLRSKLGGSIAVSLLEQRCVTEQTQPGKALPLPPKQKKVLVIGSGPSSLMAAFDLARKGYPIKVFHRMKEPGSWLADLPESDLPKGILSEEIARLEKLRVSFEQVETLDHVLFLQESADAVYIGQDDLIEQQLKALLTDADAQTLQCSPPELFTGGTSRPGHPLRFITDIAQGREAAVSIDRFLQGASLTASRTPPRNGKTDLYTNTSKITRQERIEPQVGRQYSTDEAQAEAVRCINCQCMECVTNCSYLQEFDGYPRSYARRIYNNSAIVKGTHLANTLINSCSLCGQCEELCPNDFSMASLCHESRKTMVRENRMPPSAFWFGLEEMRSARTEGSLLLHAPNTTESKILFFPGCQLAGIRPEQTLRLYNLLCELEPQTGIWLDCCGTPADWAGREELFGSTCRDLLKSWEEMGNPRVLTGCPTCQKIFREHLPQVNAELVWSTLPEGAFPQVSGGKKLALSDPCTTRKDDTLQKDIRSLLNAVGQQLAPLEMSGSLTECCGFGGGMASTNPELANTTARNRGRQTGETLLTYCAMCRDQLARGGSPVIHLLDLLFPETAHPAEEPPVHISDRRINRRALKSDLLRLHPDHQQPDQQPWEKLDLELPGEVRETMEKRRIIDDDLKKVLHLTTIKGNWLEHDKSDLRIASEKIGEVTFWVEYRKSNNTYRVKRCWSHRMQIGGGTR